MTVILLLAGTISYWCAVTEHGIGDHKQLLIQCLKSPDSALVSIFTAVLSRVVGKQEFESRGLVAELFNLYQERLNPMDVAGVSQLRALAEIARLLPADFESQALCTIVIDSISHDAAGSADARVWTDRVRVALVGLLALPVSRTSTAKYFRAHLPQLVCQWIRKHPTFDSFRSFPQQFFHVGAGETRTFEQFLVEFEYWIAPAIAEHVGKLPPAEQHTLHQALWEKLSAKFVLGTSVLSAMYVRLVWFAPQESAQAFLACKDQAFPGVQFSEVKDERDKQIVSALVSVYTVCTKSPSSIRRTLHDVDLLQIS